MAPSEASVVSGTLDLLILKTLSVDSLHGYGIALHIKRLSGDALTVEEGSLYPALQRMTTKGWITSEWKKSLTGRQARYYRLTAAGRKHLGHEEAGFAELLAAIGRVMTTR